MVKGKMEFEYRVEETYNLNYLGSQTFMLRYYPSG